MKIGENKIHIFDKMLSLVNQNNYRIVERSVNHDTNTIKFILERRDILLELPMRKRSTRI